MNACSIINERKWRRERERATTWIEEKCAQQIAWYSLAHIILCGSVIHDGNCMILLNDCVFSWLLSTTAISWTIILMTIIVGVIPFTHTYDQLENLDRLHFIYYCQLYLHTHLQRTRKHLLWFLSIWWGNSFVCEWNWTVSCEQSWGIGWTTAS